VVAQPVQSQIGAASRIVGAEPPHAITYVAAALVGTVAVAVNVTGAVGYPRGYAAGGTSGGPKTSWYALLLHRLHLAMSRSALSLLPQPRPPAKAGEVTIIMIAALKSKTEEQLRR
jgi:hypothetical protein